MSIPNFTLYGDPANPRCELLHVEDIQSRSRGHDWEIQPHIHQSLFQIVWVARGSARIALDEVDHQAASPFAVSIPPGTVHGFRFAPETQGWVLTFSSQRLLDGNLEGTGPAFQALFATPTILEPGGDDPAVARLTALFTELDSSFLSPGLGDAPVLHWLTQGILWHLAQAAQRQQARLTPNPQPQALFTRFALLVEAHHREHWPVARYATLLGMSSPRLNRLTRERCGLGALDMIHQRLTREACRLLLYTSQPVARVAAELGFDDPAYFCRFIKRRTGLSPSSYRQSRGTPHEKNPRPPEASGAAGTI
ncbi:helix-turn-helix domain-containing protein [Zoogloea sp.]|uniref:helix-turn-helix domain-containing protein n=1 Tax=Zoogloea sp. TaxID=49181 RepID=UPI0035B47450